MPGYLFHMLATGAAPPPAEFIRHLVSLNSPSPRARQLHDNNMAGVNSMAGVVDLLNEVFTRTGGHMSATHRRDFDPDFEDHDDEDDDDYDPDEDHVRYGPFDLFAATNPNRYLESLVRRTTSSGGSSSRSFASNGHQADAGTADNALKIEDSDNEEPAATTSTLCDGEVICLDDEDEQPTTTTSTSTSTTTTRSKDKVKLTTAEAAEASVTAASTNKDKT